MAILIFLVILGVLIFVHELGHFLTARRNGISASEFGFGFPPRIAGFYKDEKTGKTKLVFGKKNVSAKNTVYSINWIPLGGFVKIKGEDGEGKNDPDSFSSKPAWTRIKVLGAGVFMNFVLAWLLISLVLMIGAPEAVDPERSDIADSKIQISSVLDGSPASEAGIKTGDEILKKQKNPAGKAVEFSNISDFQDYVKDNKGKKLEIVLKRGGEEVQVSLTPRQDYPENQGPLGVSLAQTAVFSYPFYEAFWRGAVQTVELTLAIFAGLGQVIGNLFSGKGSGADVAGPVGIALLTRDVAKMGLVYVIQFTAVLSVNLGILNIMPIPALDGGRILFILLEKVKGSPVSKGMEHGFHTVGFVLLIMLMVAVTFSDVLRLIK